MGTDRRPISEVVQIVNQSTQRKLPNRSEFGSPSVQAPMAIQRVILVGILSVAAFLRFDGIGSGLPLVFSDEVTVVENALHLSWQDLNPHALLYGSLPFYFIKVVSVIASKLITLCSSCSLGLADYYLLARVFSAIFGTATVYITFLMGRALGDTKIGLATAGLVAISSTAIDLSHWATVDSMMGFWAALAFLGMIYWLSGNSMGPYLTGIATGLAVGTKYNAVILLIPIFIIVLEIETQGSGSRTRQIILAGLFVVGLFGAVSAIVWRNELLNIAAKWTVRGQLLAPYVQIFDRILILATIGMLVGLGMVIASWRGWYWPSRIVTTLTSQNLLRTLVLASVSFSIVSPFVILDFSTFARNFFFQMRKYASGGLAAFDPSSLDYKAYVEDAPALDPFQYLRSIQVEWGTLVFLGMIAGLWILWRKNRQMFLPVAAPPAFLLAMSTGWNYFTMRGLFPSWTLFASLGGIGIVAGWSWLNSRMNDPRFKTILGIGFIAILFLPPTFSSFRYLREVFLLQDTRTLTLEWVEQNIAPGTFILRDWETPEIERATLAYRVHFSGAAFEEATLSEWQQRGVRVVILGTIRYDFYTSHRDLFPSIVSDYDRLKSEWKLARTFSPDTDLKGPTIHIYTAP